MTLVWNNTGKNVTNKTKNRSGKEKKMASTWFFSCFSQLMLYLLCTDWAEKNALQKCFKIKHNKRESVDRLCGKLQKLSSGHHYCFLWFYWLAKPVWTKSVFECLICSSESCSVAAYTERISLESGILYMCSIYYNGLLIVYCTESCAEWVSEAGWKQISDLRSPPVLCYTWHEVSRPS